MKNRIFLTALLFVSLLITSCGLITNAGVKVITPSDNFTSENRNVSGFNSIEFSTFGKINIMQGDVESLNISGPDNLIPEISTTVTNNTLIIKTKQNITVTTLDSAHMLTFTIVVKELGSLSVSGAGDVQIETLSTPSLTLSLSGAGRVTQNQLTTDNLNIHLSGVGGININGKATQATIDMSGAGGVEAADLQIQNAKITISGLGGATLWVSDQLTGDISGTGSVSYYGNPQTNTNSTGLGNFKSLGSK
jgi:tellurite resistance-related uncharacterized protein